MSSLTNYVNHLLANVGETLETPLQTGGGDQDSHTVDYWVAQVAD